MIAMIDDDDDVDDDDDDDDDDTAWKETIFAFIHEWLSKVPDIIMLIS